MTYTSTCVLEGVFDQGGGKGVEPVLALLILYVHAAILGGLGGGRLTCEGPYLYVLQTIE
jgi:hypothetical protein